MMKQEGNHLNDRFISASDLAKMGVAFRSSLPKTPSERVEKYQIKNEGVTPDCWDREPPISS